MSALVHYAPDLFSQLQRFEGDVTAHEGAADNGVWLYIIVQAQDTSLLEFLMHLSC